MRLRLLAAACLLMLPLLPEVAGAAANGDGLLGTYYDQNGTSGAFFTGNTVVQVDATIDFNWGNGAPATGIGTDNFSVRWTGEIEMPNWGGGANQWVDFRTNTDDGIRVYINGTLVINNWTDHGPTQDTGTIRLRRGQRYAITIEYYERGGGAVMEFEWDPPGIGGGYHIVPQAYLYSLQPPSVSSIGFATTSADPCGDPRTLIVNWNIPVESGGGATAGDRAANFSIPSGPTVTAASLSGDGLTTTLTLGSDLVNGVSYSLQVDNVESTTGITISPDPSSYPFTPVFGTFTNGGLAASYYPALNFGGTPTERVDAQVDNDWGTGNPGITGFPANLFSVRWDGYFIVPADYNGEFWTNSDDGVRLYVNNTLVIDNWTDHGPIVDRGAIALTAGETYAIRLEYYENGGGAVIQLGYESCSLFWFGFCFGTVADTVVPSSALSYCATGAALDNFLISVAGGTASTCTPLNVSITARDASNNTLTGFSGAVALETLPIGTTHGDWSVVAGNGSVSDTTADDGQATYTFVNTDNGAVTLALGNEHADDLSIRVTDALTAVTSTSGTISFRDNAFVFAAIDAAPLADVPVAGRPHAFSVAMMRRDPGTGDCSAATGYAGSKNLKAWITRDGADPGGGAPGLDNGSTTQALPTGAPGANNFTLGFTNGVSTVDASLVTTDVGKYTLHLLDDSRSFANAVDIGGMTNTLTVRPFALAIRNITSGGTPNPNGAAAFTGAGTAYSATLTGVDWDSADDLDNDGHPDDANGDGVPENHVDLDDAANAVTTSFANDVSVSAVLASPGGVFGSFPNQNVVAGSFAGGAATFANFRYDEVGNIVMNAASADYLGTAGADIIGFSAVVGRFIPHHFDVTPVTEACGSFTYSGQPIANVTVTAKDIDGDTTQNYSDALGLSQDVFFSDGTGTLAGAFGAGNAGAIDAAEFASGTASSSLLAFTLDDPETPAGMITLRATDDDNASSNGHTEGGIQVRSGRAALLDQGAASLTDASQRVLAEWWQEITPGVYDWDTNTEDVCTVTSLATGSFSLGNWSDQLDAGETAVTAVSFSAGEGMLTLSAPGAGNEGSVLVTGDVPAWLEFDFDTNGTPEDPSATVTFFGVFETEQGFIDRREVVP